MIKQLGIWLVAARRWSHVCKATTDWLHTMQYIQINVSLLLLLYWMCKEYTAIMGGLSKLSLSKYNRNKDKVRNWMNIVNFNFSNALFRIPTAVRPITGTQRVQTSSQWRLRNCNPYFIRPKLHSPETLPLIYIPN